MTPKQIFRILDANFNRSREGLRVCEEIARFVLEDRVLTKNLKKVRHAVSGCVKDLSLGRLVSARDTLGDVGKEPSRLEKHRGDALDLFAANIERVKEALRVLEETSKLLDVAVSDDLKKIRFQAYAIEKKALSGLEALRDHRLSNGRKKTAD